MSILETPRLPEARVNPTLMMGAASPLWSYFAAAAASGVAYWWMTRWSRPANLEAFFAAAGASSNFFRFNFAIDCGPSPAMSPPRTSRTVVGR